MRAQRELPQILTQRREERGRSEGGAREERGRRGNGRKSDQLAIGHSEVVPLAGGGCGGGGGVRRLGRFVRRVLARQSKRKHVRGAGGGKKLVMHQEL